MEGIEGAEVQTQQQELFAVYSWQEVQGDRQAWVVVCVTPDKEKAFRVKRMRQQWGEAAKVTKASADTVKAWLAVGNELW